jgi:hypothetical protein
MIFVWMMSNLNVFGHDARPTSRKIWRSLVQIYQGGLSPGGLMIVDRLSVVVSRQSHLVYRQNMECECMK